MFQIEIFSTKDLDSKLNRVSEELVSTEKTYRVLEVHFKKESREWIRVTSKKIYNLKEIEDFEKMFLEIKELFRKKVFNVGFCGADIILK